MEKEKTSEEFEKELLLDSVFQLESAEAYLSEDIEFLRNIHEEYFVGECSKHSEYHYHSLEIALRTLTKSIENTLEGMRKSIDTIYANKKEREVK